MEEKERITKKKKIMHEIIDSIESPILINYIYAFLRRIFEQGN